MKMDSLVLGVSRVLAGLALLVAGWQAYEFLMNLVVVCSFEAPEHSSGNAIRYPNLRWDPLVWAFFAFIIGGLCLKFGHLFSASLVRASGRESS